MTTVNLLINGNFTESISTRSHLNQWRPESLGTGCSVSRDSAKVRLRVEGVHEYSDVHYDRDHFCSYDYLVKNRATIEVDMVDLQYASTLQIQYWVEYQTPDGSGGYELGKIYFQVRFWGSEGLSNPFVYEVFANDNHTSDTGWRTVTVTIPEELKALDPDTLIIEAWGGLKPLWGFDASIPGPHGGQGWANIYINYVSITSEIEDPVPSFTCAADSNVLPITVTFTDKTVWGNPHSTYLGAKGSYLWNFGDGQTSTDQNPTHVYTIPGEYTVTLTVTRYFTPNIVRTYTYSTPIDATHTLPVARFYAAHREIHTGDSVTFTNLSKGNPEPRSIWTINGQTYYTKHPTVTFANEGIYDVKLELSTIYDYAREYRMSGTMWYGSHEPKYMTDNDPETWWEVENNPMADHWVATIDPFEPTLPAATHYKIRCHPTDATLAPTQWLVYVIPHNTEDPPVLIDTISGLTWTAGEEKTFTLPTHDAGQRYYFAQMRSSASSNALQIAGFSIYRDSDEVLTDSVEKVGYITVMDEEYTKTSASSLYRIYFDGVLATLNGAAQPIGARYSDLNITRTIDAGEGDSAEFSIIIPSDTVAGKLTVGTEVMILNETDIIFSGEMTEVSKELLTPPNVPIQKFKYLIKCRGDLHRLDSVVTNKDNIGTAYGTPAEVVKAILPEAWQGELLDMGESSSFNIVTGSVGENLNNYIDNIKYSVRARRPRHVLKPYVVTYASSTITYTVHGDVRGILNSGDLLIHKDLDVVYTVDNLRYFTAQDKTKIEIRSPAPALPYQLGLLISPHNPVIDFGPEFDDVTGRANFIANKDAFDVKSDDAQDIKKTLFIIKGKDDNGNLISTTLPSCYVKEGAIPEGCTITSVRSEGIVERDCDGSIVYIYGHDFITTPTEYWWFVSKNAINYTYAIAQVASITKEYDEEHNPVTKLVLIPWQVTVKKGTYLCSPEKIYVDNISIFDLTTNNKYMVGEECVIVRSVGSDSLGNYICFETSPGSFPLRRYTTVTYTDGEFTSPYGYIPHGAGTLVRPCSLDGIHALNADHPQEGSPIDLYGKRLESVNISNNTNIAVLEQYATACLVNGSTPYKTGEITVTPYQLRDMTSSTFSRIKPGDMVSITHPDGTVDEVRVSKYTIDAMRMQATIEYGEVRKDLINAINKKLLANTSNV